MSIRSELFKEAGVKHSTPAAQRENVKHSHLFDSLVFGRRQIEQSLPKKQADNWLAAMNGKERVEKENLDLFAEALKEWAQHFGATHFTHWFHPMTGNGAEKHDSFLAKKGDGIIEHFSGKDLLRGEPDASSFPNGGLRSTSQARGYTVWDPSTPPFLWKEAGGFTLCIPSLFFSWKGEALDYKIGLLRSDQKIESAVLRLLKLSGIEAKNVFSTLGPEQEYFAIDRTLYNERSDLVLSGRTVYGAKPAKGQELEDHYFSSLSERTLLFMREYEEEALALGIPLKTRHNEVAPSQHEAAPIFERASLAADHNQLLMELMRQTAVRHDLACLFHEKPFATLNGSGKHCNWSLATDTGLNLLDPKEDDFAFLVLLAAILRAVHEHSLLLRCCVASASNDWRLGGAEAPPSILSVDLGKALEECVERILHEHPKGNEVHRVLDLGLLHVVCDDPDQSDRNRTSFFAFTGNKFEFRAVGASQHTAWPICVINAIVSDSLHLILDEIENEIEKNSAQSDLLTASMPVLRKHFKAAQSIFFSGNNYAKEWEEEAQRRNLPNVKKSFHAYSVLRDPKTHRVFNEIYSKEELESRFDILVERYAKEVGIECSLMIDLFRTSILPASVRWQSEWAASVDLLQTLQIDAEKQKDALWEFSRYLAKAIEAVDALEKIVRSFADLGWEAAARAYCELALPRMEEARSAVDLLEGRVDHALWPLPKYNEMLFTK
jgi:glutamine synthetase